MGGHGGFLVVACVWLRAQSAERTASSIGVHVFFILKASPPARGWVLFMVLFGGQLGGRSETTSGSRRERFLSCLALGYATLFYVVIPKKVVV